MTQKLVHNILLGIWWAFLLAILGAIVYLAVQIPIVGWMFISFALVVVCLLIFIGKILTTLENKFSDWRKTLPKG